MTPADPITRDDAYEITAAMEALKNLRRRLDGVHFSLYNADDPAPARRLTEDELRASSRAAVIAARLSVVATVADDALFDVLNAAASFGGSPTANAAIDELHAQAHPCVECGHAHFRGRLTGYSVCPIEGCECRGQR